MPSCVKDSVNSKVIFGKGEGMSLTSYEGIPLVQQYSHTSWGYTIDINGDGKDDIQFRSEDIGSAGVGHDIVTELNCLSENIALLGDIINQEKYLHISSSLYTEDSIWWVNVVSKTYTCEQIAETDSVVSTTEKLTNIDHNPSDSYGLDDTFMSTKVILKNRSYDYPCGSETIENVTYHYMIHDNNNCDFFPMEVEKYIGFKITENDKDRLGWMKVILHHDYVELMETAIQK